MTKQYTITHPQKRILYTELINNVPGSYNFVGTMLFPEGEQSALKLLYSLPWLKHLIFSSDSIWRITAN